MKILMLTWEYPPRVVGGIENYNKAKIIEEYGKDIDSGLFRQKALWHLNQLRLLIRWSMVLWSGLENTKSQ